MAYRVLLSVEDSDSEYYIIKMAVEEVKNPVQVCEVGEREQAQTEQHDYNLFRVLEKAQKGGSLDNLIAIVGGETEARRVLDAYNCSIEKYGVPNLR